MLWLRTGEEVQRRFGINPSKLSRQCRKCLDVFELSLQRIGGEWNTIGDTSELFLERHVHQTARFMEYRPLRLEAAYWSGPLLCTPEPVGWKLGRANIVGIARNLFLVRERIVDAWVASFPDVPSDEDGELASIALSSMPVFFVANPEHPLAGKASISISDIAEYPTLGLPPGSYPEVEKTLLSIGLWNNHVRMSRYRRDKWEGKSESELTIGYGTPLSMEMSGGSLVRLPLNLPFNAGEAIVVRKEFLKHPEILTLRNSLLARLQVFADQKLEIKVFHR